MKRVTILVMLFLIPALGVCQQGGTYRDRYGNTSGSWQDNGNQRTYRDAYGNTEGTSTRDNAGGIIGTVPVTIRGAETGTGGRTGELA